MPEYIPRALTHLNHPAPKKPQYAPHRWTAPSYEQRLQMDPDPDSSELLNQKGIKFIQTVVGIFLYYAQALNPTMLRALNEISRIQARPTKGIMAQSKWFLDYAATYPNAIIRYHARKMVLHIESDAAYLVMLEARSVYAGHFYLGSWPRDKPNLPSTTSEAVTSDGATSDG